MTDKKKKDEPIETILESQDQSITSLFDNLNKDMGKRSTSAIIGGTKGLLDFGLGLYGLFKDDNIGAPAYESTYQTSNVLPALRDRAMMEAFSGKDDYAARIRARNQRDMAVQSAINRSGGSRAFVQSNVAAADDVFNLANLGIDKEMEAARINALNTAGNLENLVIQDKLNKMKDMQYSNEDKYRKLMAEITLDRENRQGAMGMMSSGLNDVAQAASMEDMWGKNGTMKQIQLANLMLSAKKAGVDLFGGEKQSTFVLGPVDTGMNHTPMENPANVSLFGRNGE